MMDLLADSTQPVDPELFLWCQGVYHAAASLSMPVENPGSRPLLTHNDKTYAFADIPINRGMLAVMKELRERGLSDEQKMSLSCRLMHFGEVFGPKELEPFIKKGNTLDEVQVSEALIKACATAKMVLVDERFRFDIVDIVNIAQKLTDEEEAKE